MPDDADPTAHDPDESPDDDPQQPHDSAGNDPQQPEEVADGGVFERAEPPQPEDVEPEVKHAADAEALRFHIPHAVGPTLHSIVPRSLRDDDRDPDWGETMWGQDDAPGGYWYNSPDGWDFLVLPKAISSSTRLWCAIDAYPGTIFAICQCDESQDEDHEGDTPPALSVRIDLADPEARRQFAMQIANLYPQGRLGRALPEEVTHKEIPGVGIMGSIDFAAGWKRVCAQYEQFLEDVAADVAERLPRRTHTNSTNTLFALLRSST